jgi:hypothetical protein
MNAELIRRLALEAGLADPDLSQADHSLMLFCTKANPDADALPDYLPDDNLARRVAALLNAAGVEASDKTCRFCGLTVPHPCTSNRGAQDCHEQPGDGVATGERPTSLQLTIRQDSDSGWWIIAGPPESGLYIAHQSLEVCVSDILPSWRAMAKLSPDQVPPVPDASGVAIPDGAQQ